MYDESISMYKAEKTSYKKNMACLSECVSVLLLCVVVALFLGQTISVHFYLNLFRNLSRLDGALLLYTKS